MSDFDWVRNRATDSQLREYVADKANLHNKLSLRGVEIEELQSELAAARQELGELQAARIRPAFMPAIEGRETWDLTTIPADALYSEVSRRRGLAGGRHKKLQPCPKCGAILGVRERRVKCPHTQGEKETK